MKGEERWLWIDTDDVSPYYVDCDAGSKSQMFTESKVSAEQMTVSYAFVLSQIVFHQYQEYLGINLTGDDQLHYNNAILYQKQAIFVLKQSQDIDDYLTSLNMAYDEYQEIQS
jgi:hypothetical protein